VGAAAGPRTTVAEGPVLSARARALAPSPTMAFDARAKALAAEGRDIINLTAGEPDFDTVPAAAEAAVAAIRAGFTHYTEAAGVRSLREAIAEKLERENGLRYAPEEIAVTTGAKFALHAAMEVLCDPGDEVLVPAPYWVSYPEQAKLAGAVPVFVPTREEDGFVLRAEELRRHLGPRSRLLVLNSPNNPTGAVIPPEELRAIGEVVLAHPRLMVLSDEIYEKMVYDGARHESIAALDAELRRRTVTVNGLSKAYAMTGWRLGYTAAERPVAGAIAAFLSQTTSNVTSIAQRAAEGALRGDPAPVAAMIAEFAARRTYVLGRLAAMPGLRLRPPGGAFYVFPNVAAALGRRTAGGAPLPDVDAFAARLMEEAGLATVPGTGFGSPQHVRISYAAARPRLERGLDRLEAFLRGLA
jgi:aspartate aminotransferase